MRQIAQHRRFGRGDTIIEVMFAFGVFASLAVGSIMIMSRGAAMAQRSLEITQVRAQMSAQVNALQYVHKAYTANYPAVNATWAEMTTPITAGGKGETQASQFGLGGSTTECPAFTADQRPFVLNARTAQLWSTTPSVESTDGTLPPYSQVVYNSSDAISRAYGIWVEAVPSLPDGKKAGFVDFHVRACWSSAGSAVPMTLGTIVRLYEPLT